MKWHVNLPQQNNGETIDGCNGTSSAVSAAEIEDDLRLRGAGCIDPRKARLRYQKSRLPRVQVTAGGFSPSGAIRGLSANNLFKVIFAITRKPLEAP